jgi:hypothetical protein
LKEREVDRYQSNPEALKYFHKRQELELKLAQVELENQG